MGGNRRRDLLEVSIPLRDVDIDVGLRRIRPHQGWRLGAAIVPGPGGDREDGERPGNPPVKTGQGDQKDKKDKQDFAKHAGKHDGRCRTPSSGIFAAYILWGSVELCRGRASRGIGAVWYSWVGLNHRPPDPQSGPSHTAW